MAKIARRTNLTNSTLTKRKGQEGLREVREFSKNRKNKKNFSCHVKRLSKKYGKNSKNSSLRKHPFLLALRRWGRLAPPREPSPAAKSEEKPWFSQTSRTGTRRGNVYRSVREKREIVIYRQNVFYKQ